MQEGLLESQGGSSGHDLDQEETIRALFTGSRKALEGIYTDRCDGWAVLEAYSTYDVESRIKRNKSDIQRIVSK